MDSWGSYSYAFGPVVTLGVMVVLGLLLRWAFGRGRSVVQRPAAPGAETDYGLLRAVASPSTFIEAEVLRQILEAEGLRVTVAPTTDGPRVMVFSRDEDVARTILARRST